MNSQLENAEQALASVNAASGTARGLFTGFMFLTGYLAVVLASTDDMQLFLYTPIKLPFFNIDIDIRGFYTIMPWLYLIIHANMLLIFAFLTDKINHLEAALQPLYFEQRQGLMKRLHVLIFVQYLSKQHPGTMAWIIALIVWFSIAFVPLLLLLWLQLDFLPAQEEVVILGQRAAVAVDVGLILYFWNNILQKRRRSLLPENWDLPFWKRYTLGGYALGFLSITCLFISSVIVVIPFSTWDKYLTGNDPENVQRIINFKKINGLEEIDEDKLVAIKTTMDWNNRLRAVFFGVMPFKQWLELQEQIITGNELDAEVKNQLIQLQSGKEIDLEEINDQIIGYNARENPNLRFAQFSKIVLIKADLEEASLQGADLGRAKLQDADLGEASLQGANLFRASLQGADLYKASLQGADLRVAKLQGADLEEARLQGANLWYARLQGANLNMAWLQGANLRDAQLQGANLTRAELQGANLRDAQLQGADLSWASLQGADLGEASLQGANLNMAWLQGADLSWASLQGANLQGAKLQGANLRDAQLQGANLERADISLSVFADERSWGEEDKQRLLKNIQQQPLAAEQIDSIEKRIESAWNDQALQGNFASMENCVRTEDYTGYLRPINDCEYLQVDSPKYRQPLREFIQRHSELIAELVCAEPALSVTDHFYIRSFIKAGADQIQNKSDKYNLTTEKIYLFAALDKKLGNGATCENKETLNDLWKTEIGDEKLKLLRARAENRASEDIVF